MPKDGFYGHYKMAGGLLRKPSARPCLVCEEEFLSREPKTRRRICPGCMDTRQATPPSELEFAAGWPR
jgi:hypothetical protein